MRRAPLEVGGGLLLRRVQGIGHKSVSLWEQTGRTQMGSCEAGGAGCHSAQVAGRPGEEPCTCHAAGDGPRGPQLKKPVCALSCWEGPCQAAYGPSPPHPAPRRPSSARPAEPEQSPPQVCPESGLPKGVRERTSPARWQQERRKAGLGREASARPALCSGSGRPHSSPHTAKESRTCPKPDSGAGCRFLAQ